MLRTVTDDLYNPHEDGDGENQDKLLDCNRDGRLGQLSQLQHVFASVDGLGYDLHDNVVDDAWDYTLGNCDFFQLLKHCYP